VSVSAFVRNRGGRAGAAERHAHTVQQSLATLGDMFIRTQQEANTSLAAADVLASATDFFANRNSIYTAYPEKSGPTFVALRGQGGEDVVFGVAAIPGGTRVTGSSYMFDQQIARFLSMLPPYVAPPPATELTAVAPNATPGAIAA
jgi:hypothetical protein